MTVVMLSATHLAACCEAHVTKKIICNFMPFMKCSSLLSVPFLPF